MLGGHSSSRTDLGASSTYTTTDSGSSEPQCSLPLAFPSSSSLQLAFFVTHPLPLKLPLRPHCHLGIYRCQRSCATRAAILPHRLRQWKYRTRLIDGIYHLNGFGFLSSLYSSGFYSFILVIISMYLFGFEKLGHFCDHIRQFGNIPMYSTEIGELAHKTQIKEGWRQSNKNDAARQIVHSYGRQHAIRMRLLNLECLQDRGESLSADVLNHLDRTTSTVSQPVIRRRILTGRRDDVSNVDDFSRISGVSLDIIYRELIQYSRHNLPIDHRLPEDHAIL